MAPAENPSAPTPDSVTANPVAAPAAAPPAGDSPAPTGIQTAPDAPIPLPPPPAPPPKGPVPAPDALLRKFARLDVALVGVALLFAFLVASFPASNTDLFLHLATGRLLRQGAHKPWSGADPFTFTAGGSWVNHSWLFDLLAYLGYSIPTIGGAALVVLKALLVVGLAVVMLRTARGPGQRLWVPAACVALAILALSPRLLLQPAVFSFFFLGLTLWLLSAPGVPRRWWLIPAVCVLWVNLDSWFLLGPITVLLFLAGEWLQAQFGPEPAPSPERLRTLARVLGASLVACLVNPHHVRAFTLPETLGLNPASVELFKDPQFRGMFVSPWEKLYFPRTFGLSAAGLAYVPLALLGLLSFILTFGAWRWWRVLLWLSFLALSSVNWRTVPFFAVVASPITALNFLDFARCLADPEGRLPLSAWRWALAGRVITLLLGVGLVVAAVPGWTQAQPHSRRWLGWGVQVDPSLESAALKIRDWRERGLVPEGTHWFSVSPEVGNYLAWFCPGELGCLDSRLQLFAGVAPDFLKVRHALAEVPKRAEGEQPPPAWREVFEGRKLRFLVFHTSDLSRAEVPLFKLYSNPREWVPLHLEGRTAIFGWVAPGDEAAARSLAPLAIHFNRRAFGPEAVKAPSGRARPAGALPKWKALLAPPPPPSVDAGAAFQHNLRFTALGPRYSHEHQTGWQASLAASALGTAGLPGGPLLNGAWAPARLSFAFRLIHDRSQAGGAVLPSDRASEELLRRYLWAQDQGPPSSLYLAVRAARRALVHNPDDARAYLALAEAYLRLGRQTRELPRTHVLLMPNPGPGAAGGGAEAREPQLKAFLPHVRVIRHSQLVSALNGMLAVRPPAEVARVAHALLAEVYRQQPEYFELRVKHFREVVRLSRELGPPPGVEAKRHKEQLNELDKVAKELARGPRGLQSRQDRYEVDSAGKPPLQKAQIALREGLAETALNVLQKAEVKEPVSRHAAETPGVTVAVQLLLGLGRLEKARETLEQKGPDDKPIDRRLFGTLWLDPEDPRDPGHQGDSRGLPAYEWLRAQLAAASGAYAEADRHLAEAQAWGARTPTGPQTLMRLGVLPRSGVEWKGGDATLAGALVGHLLLTEAPQAAGTAWPLLRRLSGSGRQLAQANGFSAGALQYEAELRALRSWLALEAGDLARAQEQARAALELALIRGAGGRPTQIMPFRSRPLAGLCLELAEGGKKAAGE
jgi:tetratricopeptide (TPR) repeat protein